jgi:DNA-binding transcriptional LysR family regulator
MDQFKSMQVFTLVVETGSFTAASNVLNKSPAMVSKHINELEARLGATLLNRTTRRLHVTEIGKNYYTSCKEILQQVELAEAGTAILKDKPQGRLRVSASVSFGSMTLTPVICDYLKKYPDVNIDLSLNDRYVDIIDEGFDVAIRIGELNDSTYIARKVSSFEITICASPEYLAIHGTPIKPSELKEHQCLGFTNWRAQNSWKQFDKSIAQTEHLIRFNTNNGQSLREAALRGIGIIMMPKLLVMRDVVAGNLIEILQDYLPEARPIYAVYPSKRQSIPKVKTFIDFIASELN